jgi:uncharacterized membrane protein YdjX (TVP38/TMEM64 family)
VNRFMQDRLVWRRAVILVALCVALAALAAAEDVHKALLELLAVAEEVIRQHALAGASLFVILASISAMFTFVSVAIIVPAAVFAWGELVSMSLLWLGWTLGGAATYSVGRWLGRRVVRWIVTNSALYRFQRQVQRNAPFWLVLLLQLALPSEIPGYVLGLARYSFPRYLLALSLAELPYTVATVYLGASFLERRWAVILAAGLSVALLSVVAFYLLRRVMRPKAPKQHV